MGIYSNPPVLLTSEEGRTISEKAHAEADKTGKTLEGAPDNPLRAAAPSPCQRPTLDGALKTWEIERSLNIIDRICKGLKEGVPKQSINKVQEVKQKPNEDLPKFLEVVFKAYGCYMNIDPEPPTPPPRI